MELHYRAHRVVLYTRYQADFCMHTLPEACSRCAFGRGAVCCVLCAAQRGKSCRVSSKVGPAGYYCCCPRGPECARGILASRRARLNFLRSPCDWCCLCAAIKRITCVRITNGRDNSFSGETARYQDLRVLMFQHTEIARCCTLYELRTLHMCPDLCRTARHIFAVACACGSPPKLQKSEM